MNKELGDIFADIENRLAFLEALHTPADCSYRSVKTETQFLPVIKEKPVSSNDIGELKSKFIDLQNKINNHIDSSKKPKSTF